MEPANEKTITIPMDIEDEIGNKFNAQVTISIPELRQALRAVNLDIYKK